MFKSFLFGCLLLLSHSVFCQGQYTLSIVVQHKQQPIDNAVVKLLKPSDSSVVTTTISNAKGIASFSALPAGKFLVQVSFTGFATNITSVEIPAEKIVTIQLQPSVSTLQDVTVVTKKPFLQRAQGKTIVNVEASVTNAGTTVLEVLEKLPGIMVDKAGAINMLGKTGVLVMIDDKPTYVSGTDLNNLLSSMSSQQVDQIELITNPSSKYDSNGNAGIINIKTKKNKQVGFNGIATVSVGQGRYSKSNNSLVLNYRNGKLNAFFNYSINYNKGFTSIYAWREYYNNSGAVTAILEQPTYLLNDNINNTFKTGLDFYANKKITIGASFTGGIINRNGYGEATAIWRKANGSIDSTIGTYSNSFNKFRNTATNIYLKNALTNTQDISVDLDFLTYNIGNDQGFNNVLLATGGYNNASHGNIPSRINIWSAKADYNWRFGNAGKLEAGAKSSYINTDNIAAYEQYDGTTWKEDLGKSNHFLYKESINALYASIEQKAQTY